MSSKWVRWRASGPNSRRAEDNRSTFGELSRPRPNVWPLDETRAFERCHPACQPIPPDIWSAPEPWSSAPGRRKNLHNLSAPPDQLHETRKLPACGNLTPRCEPALATLPRSAPPGSGTAVRIARVTKCRTRCCDGGRRARLHGAPSKVVRHLVSRRAGENWRELASGRPRRRRILQRGGRSQRALRG